MPRFLAGVALAAACCSSALSQKPASDTKAYPIDKLGRDKIGEKDLTDAGDGNPTLAPPELVAVQPSPGVKKGYTCAAFSADGRHLVLGTEDGVVVDWDLTRNKLNPAPFHKGRVWEVRVAPNGKEFASTGSDGKIHVRPLAAGGRTADFPGKSGDHGTLAYGPDGKRVLVGNGGVLRLIHTADAKKEVALKGRDFSATAIAFAPDGKTLAAGNYEGTEGEVRLWDAATGEQTIKLDKPGRPVHSLDFRPDGSLLASTHQYRNAVQLWNPATGQNVRKLDKHTATVRQAVFTPAGDALVSVSEDGTVRVWDPDAGTEKRKIAVGMKGGLLRVAVSPEGRHLAVVHTKGVVYVLRLGPPE